MANREKHFLGNLFSGISSGIEKSSQTKLQLALLSKRIEMEQEAEMEQEQAKFQRSVIPSSEFMRLPGALRGEQGTDYSQFKHPKSQEAIIGSQRPLLAASQRSGNSRDLVELRHRLALDRMQKKNELERLDDTSVTQAVLDNPDLFDALPKNKAFRLIPQLARSGFTYLGKPLGENLQNRALSAESGLRAIDRVNKLKEIEPEKFKMLYVPGSIGAKNLETDLRELMDVVTRIRTGAALNQDEQTFYRSQLIRDDLSNLLEDLADGTLDNKALFYSMNTVYRPYLEDMRNVREKRKTAVVEGREDKGAKARANMENKVKPVSEMSTEEKLKELGL